MFTFLKELYPICRSLTGNGTLKTLEMIKEYIPIEIKNIKSGTQVYDWTVPDIWNVKDAFIKDSSGKKIIDFNKNNLHLVSYSIPFSGILTLDQLKEHLHYKEDLPTAIPYLTTYYKRYWGFCMTYDQFKDLKDDTYEVVIDTTLEPGKLYYADYVIPGKVKREVLISCYICHPSMANDSISGVVLATYLAKYISERENYYTYRFVFIPETIGSIIYINQNYEHLKNNVIGGYVITCVGDPGKFTYLQTRKENQLTDKITLHILKNSVNDFKLRNFFFSGSDERQYNFPNVDLNIGSLLRTRYGEFKEYHTSLDNLDFVKEESLKESLGMYIKCLLAFEYNHKYKINCICEPFLSKRGIYPNLGAQVPSKSHMTFMSLIKNCDGELSLLEIADKIGCPIEDLYSNVDLLLKHKLISF